VSDRWRKVLTLLAALLIAALAVWNGKPLRAPHRSAPADSHVAPDAAP